jgi:hypothetical protein
MSSTRFYIGVALALWLAFALRTADLYSLPLYHDEGDHIRWAQFYETGNPNYPIFMDGKYLLGVTLAQLHVYGPESIWVSRAGVAIFSMLACASSIAVGKMLGGKPAGLVAGFIYALLPLAAFYERQVVADALAASYGAVAVALTLKLAVTRKGRWAIALGLALALSFLAKFFGALFLAFPFFAIFVTAVSRRDLFWKFRYYTLAVGIAALIAGGFLFWMRPMLGYNNNLMAQQRVGHITCPPLLCEGNLDKQIDNFNTAGRTLYDLATHYTGWPLAVLIGFGVVLVPAAQRRRIWLVVIAEVAMFATLVSAAYTLPPRYIPFLSLPISVLGAAGAVWLIERLHPKAVQWAAAAALVLVNLWPVYNTFMLITRPEQASMPYGDYLNYIIGGISGPGLLDAKQLITNREASNPLPPVIIISQRWRDQLNATLVHFDVTKVKAVEAHTVTIRDVGNWLNTNTPVYIVDIVAADYDDTNDTGGAYPGLTVEEVLRYPREQGAYYLRILHINGHDETLLPKLFAEFFIRPNEIPSTYEALTASLPATDDLALAVYPPSQADILTPLLMDHPNVTLYPIGNSWPLDIPASQIELSSIAAKHTDLRVVFLGETIGDPTRQLETWLNTNLYRVAETWMEPVRMLDYVGGGTTGETVGNDIKFGDGITLESVSLLDSSIASGGLVRLRLQWQADALSVTQYKVFVHIFSGESIIAQHDGQPMGELRPTTTWQAGETIVDQFAISLPPDAPIGSYQLRIGLYDLATGARLPLANGDEFWTGGTVTIQ